MANAMDTATLTVEYQGPKKSQGINATALMLGQDSPVSYFGAGALPRVLDGTYKA
jgi:hypothetical protein